MSTEPPQLPAFLTQPLTCPSNRCNYPERPLPPIPTELETILPIWLFRRLEEYLEIDRTPNPTTTQQKMDGLIILALRSTKSSPKTLRQNSEASGILEERYLPKLDDTSKYLVIKEAVAHSLARGVEEINGVFGERCCLHTLLDPSFVGHWESMYSSTTRTETTFTKEEAEPLLERVMAAIEAGELHDEDWGENEEWEREILLLQESCTQAVKDRFGRAMREAFETSGYQEVVKGANAVLGLLSQLLDTKTISLAGIRSFTKIPPELAQLVRFCQGAAPIRTDAVAGASPTTTTLAPSSSIDSASSSIFHSVPRNTSSSPSADQIRSQKEISPTFDRFKRLENHPDDPPHFRRFDIPRFYSPDRCSGQLPLYEKFALVDKIISDTFGIRMEMISMDFVKGEHGKMQLAAINALLPQLDSLGALTPSQQEKIEEVVSIACREYAHHHRKTADHSQYELPCDAMFYVNTEEILGALLEGFRALDGEAHDRTWFACFCFLSRQTDRLLRLRTAYQLQLEETIADIRQRSTENAALCADVGRRIESGKLAFKGSRRGDWRKKLDELIDFVEEAVADFIVNDHRHFYPEGYTRFSTVISSAQIMEELSGFVFDPSEERYMIFEEIGTLPAIVDPRAAHSTESIKLLGDKVSHQHHLISRKDASQEDVWTNAVDVYRTASMLDPSNFGARLNSASVRLRLADNRSNAFQWSRIVYDCSAAIYYGSTSFKAYYRRGYALTRLKLWEKAILDFDQALLIEPKDPLVELCRAAAKRKTVL